jgi:hypothetical protein
VRRVTGSDVDPALAAVGLGDQAKHPTLRRGDAGVLGVDAPDECFVVVVLHRDLGLVTGEERSEHIEHTFDCQESLPSLRRTSGATPNVGRNVPPQRRNAERSDSVLGADLAPYPRSK